MVVVEPIVPVQVQQRWQESPHAVLLPPVVLLSSVLLQQPPPTLSEHPMQTPSALQP
jgi:hypothetical protein